jgi:hypothetical protein
MADIYDWWDRFKHVFQGLALHGTIAIVGGMIAGFLLATVLEAAGSSVSFMLLAFVAVAIPLGYWVVHEHPNRWARWVWIPGLLYLSANVYGATKRWDYSWAHQSRFQYVLSTYFGPDCGASECMDVFMITAPAICTFGYSLGAALRVRCKQIAS